MLDDIDNLLDDAINAHEAKDFNAAAIKYTKILEQDAHHADANHNFGLLTIELGFKDEALIFLQTAINTNPNVLQYWVTCLDTLINIERFYDAQSVLEKAHLFGYTDEVFEHLRHNLDLKQQQCGTLVKLTQAGDVKTDFDQATLEICEDGDGDASSVQSDGGVISNDKVSQQEEPPIEQIQSLMDMLSQQRFTQVYEQAQELTKQYSNNLTLWNIMGSAAAQNGQLDQAAFAFDKAINIKPDSAEIQNNIGNVYQEQKKLGDATAAYLKAISIKPNYADAYCNMGNCLVGQGRIKEALEAYFKAVEIKPNYAAAYNNMGIALKGFVFDEPAFALHKIIVALLNQKIYARPEYIAAAGISLLKLEPDLQKQLRQCEFNDLRINLAEVNSVLNKYPLLTSLMNVCPIPDTEFEKLFTNLRRAILSAVSISEIPIGILKFQKALALQCFTNDYIYEENSDEKKLLEVLNQAVTDALRENKQPRPEIILALASYRALNQFDWCNSLAVTNEIQEVFNRQVEEPNQEKKLKIKIPTLQEMSDKVSSKVRQQYEESPYPRWVNEGLRLTPVSISEVINEINLKLFSNNIIEVDAPDILVAGCGTGQHSIGTAKRFKGSKVLAIDLSLSSLAYAKRKTDELGIKNIEYMHADILDCTQLNKQFNIIESAGVLHHMDNPMAGWKVLTECLKPGGIMKIGLYSELARQDIVKVRQEISNAGIGSGDAEMRSFRDTIIKSYKNYYEQIKNSSDFYSLSTLRDLLFHVQEHRFTIPQIKACLAELGLEFCGFEEPSIVSHFRQTSKDKDDLYDLDKWQAYEEVNPRAFAGMYQFWCQKVD